MRTCTMAAKSALLTLFVLATTASAATTTATLLLPNVCVTKATPAVTIIGQANGLTTYSYSCSINTAAVSSAEAKASSIVASVERKASELEASLNKWLPTGLPKRDIEVAVLEKRAGECYGWNAFEACIPWVVTQGASYWAVRVTAPAVVGVEQVCTFGDGGVASGPATCTASGRIDPQIWGTGGGSHTETFAKSQVDNHFIRNTVVATTGTGTPVTNSAGATVGFAGSNNGNSRGVAAPAALPTGAVAMMAGAGGILVAALAL